VIGLRRQEVATLADISFDYYLRLEQGRHQQPSEQVLAALGRALLLDEDAMTYVYRLARDAGRPARFRPLASSPALNENMARLLEHWADTPALIFDRNHDIVMANRLAMVLGGGFLDPGSNLVITAFDRSVRDTASDWVNGALQSVAALRFQSDPYDPRLGEIVAVLSRADDDFRAMWARHDARPLRSGQFRSYVEGAGLVDLRFQNFAVPGHTGHTLSTFFASPGSPGDAVLADLAQRVSSETATRGLSPVSASPAVSMRSAG
jgi:transcriptional regulator with XRE-family HTH domain